MTISPCPDEALEAIERLREIAYRDEAKTVSVRSEDLREALEAMQRYVLRVISARSPQDAGVAVKPMEWDKRGQSSDIYQIKLTYGQGPKQFMLVRGSYIIGYFDDQKPAEAVAQADYEQRIRSALVPAPTAEAALAETGRQPAQATDPAPIWWEEMDAAYERAAKVAQADKGGPDVSERIAKAIRAMKESSNG